MHHLRNKRISFDENSHTYYVDSSQVSQSVTQFVSQFFKEFDTHEVIEKWYSYWQSNENSKYYAMAKEEISTYWKKTGDDARDRGTQIHRAIEEYELLGKMSQSREFEQYLEFKKESNIQILGIEWRIFDEELDIAGTVDCIAKDNSSGEIYIFDWKRVKEIKETSPDNALYPLEHLANSNYWKYALQLNMYKYILEKHYNMKISGTYLVQLHDELEEFNKVKVVNMEYEIQKMVRYTN
ncbi:MAG: PD-(D/E)XK nuclease family protein [Candidatus Nanoarchaeia archaeon]